MKNSSRHQILAQLGNLVGLQLTAARRAADLRTLQFGDLVPVDGGSVGKWSLHIQCPWRLDGPEGIITGRLDLRKPVDRQQHFDVTNWDYEKSPNLQDFKFDEVMARFAAELKVVSVDADDYGGAVIAFKPDIVLRIFPASSRGEAWRLFHYHSESAHFVVSGGAIEEDDEE